MSEENLIENQPELDEPLSAEEFMANFLQDLVLDNDPNDLATDFVDEFVCRDRPETPQLAAMLEMPTENLVELVKAVIEQGYQTQLQAVDERGFQFLESLKAAIKTQMTEIAEQ